MNHQYYIVKSSRDSDEPYCGPTSDSKPAVYDTLREALDAVKQFDKRNPVGWEIKHREVK